MNSTNKISQRRWRLTNAILRLLALGMTMVIITLGLTLSRARADTIETLSTTEGMIEARFIEPDSKAGIQLNAVELAKLQKRYLESREAVASQEAVSKMGIDLEGLKDVDVEETVLNENFVIADEKLGLDVRGPQFHGDPTALFIGRNKINTVGPVAPSIKSSLGEPAVANVGKRVFYTGNTFASFSSNRGLTWTDRAVPPPLREGDTLCCDQDVEYDRGRDRVFWSLLYLNPPLATEGVITIAVMSSPINAPVCLYDFTFPTNIVPDYPHIGLSNDFLYFNTNNIDTKGTGSKLDDTWAGSQMFRINLDQMVDCATASFNTFTWNTGNQRVFLPVEGATDRMYWGILGPLNENNEATSFRIFEWPETSGTVTNILKPISASTHTNPDCRGGVGDNDFIEKDTAWSAGGFRMRGWYGQPNRGGGQDVVGFLWNTGSDSSHSQGHIHAAIFDADSKDLIRQPHIFNNTFCFGFPDVAVTARDHPAVILAWGGKAGGGGTAASSAVLLGDDTVTSGGPFGPATPNTIVTGTHNRSDGRYGDYLTIQQHEPCGQFLVASSYALVDGTAGRNAEHHYIEFGRRRDKPCYDHWKGK